MKLEKSMNAFQLKLLMAVLMVFDHLSYIPHLLPVGWDGIFHLLTRCVGVWFGFAAVEGFLYTHNRKLYNLRLFFWAGLMFLGNSLLNWCLASKEIMISNNIFLTLACGVLMLNLFFGFSKDSSSDRQGHKWLRLVLGILVFLLAAFCTEGGTIILPFMLITYLTRKRAKLRNFLYLLFSILLFCLSFIPYPTVSETVFMLLYNSDWCFITVVPFLYLYNGERGSASKTAKYFFYIFYPAHLWLIALIASLVH